MILHVIESSSRANCFILNSGNSVLILECGVPFKKVLNELDFDLTKIDGCLLTHEHGDHSKFVHQFVDRGMKIYGSHGTLSKLKQKDKFRPLQLKKVYRIGEFKVMPFDVRHDAEQPTGFLINHRTGGNILFSIDTCYIPYRFKNLNAVIIEANFDLNILDHYVREGQIEPFIRNRILQNHMNIETVEKMLKNNDLSGLRGVVLTHLSSWNSDKEDFKKRISGITGVPTYIAEKGSLIYLQEVSKYGF